MRTAAVALLVLGAVALVAVLVPRSPQRELTAGELAWVRAFVDWRDERWRGVAVAYDELGSAPDREQTERIAADLRRCARSLEREVGPAPRVLTSVRAAADDACAAAQTSAELLSGGDSSALSDARSALLEADRALVRTDASLDRLLLLRRGLPAVEVPSPESRVDPRLSAAATAVSGVPMRVRCWSTSDWPRASRELAALAGRGDAEVPDEAGSWDGEPSLSPSICAALAPVVPGDGLRATAGLAHGLGVLGREIAFASGAVDVAEATCRGIELVAELATRLGASPEASDELAALALQGSSASVTCPAPVP